MPYGAQLVSDLLEHHAEDRDLRLRDLAALSALPAIWSSAEPLLIVEALAAALYATLAPEFVFVSVSTAPGAPPIAVAQTDRYNTEPMLAGRIGPAILDRARSHDSEEPLHVTDLRGFGALYVSVRPLGPNAEFGAIAVGVSGEARLKPFDRLVLSVAATQATAAIQNVRLLQSLRESEKSVLNANAELADRLAELEMISTELKDSRRAALNLLEDAIESREALRKSERRLELALTAGTMGAWEWDIAANRMFWSIGTEQIHGLQPGAFGGTFEDFKKGVHPGDLAQVLAEIHDAIEERRDQHVVYRTNHPEAGVRWLEAFGRLSLDPEGKPERMVGVCIDITERKRAEETERLLSAELQHRTKNLFAVIQALALRTLRGNPMLDDVRNTFVGRLQALARSDSRLINSGWSGASLHGIIKSELEYFSDQVKSEGAEVFLAPRATQNFALVIHELATNAAKYGSLSNPNGEVVINWSIGEGGDGGSLHFRWYERGGPPVTPPKRKGFGTSLLESALGKGRIEYGAEGLSYEIELRLADIVVAPRAPAGLPEAFSQAFRGEEVSGEA